MTLERQPSKFARYLHVALLGSFGSLLDSGFLTFPPFSYSDAQEKSGSYL